MADRKKVERDLANNQRWASTYRDGSLGVVTPIDMPVSIRAYAIVDGDRNDGSPIGVSDVLAHVLEIDAWLVGVKVFVRYETEDGTRRLKVMAEDADGVSVLETWELADR
jgi:hypothetical protein